METGIESRAGIKITDEDVTSFIRVLSHILRNGKQAFVVGAGTEVSPQLADQALLVFGVQHQGMSAEVLHEWTGTPGHRAVERRRIREDFREESRTRP